MSTQINSVNSRVGRKPIVVPSGVDIKIASHEMSIKGPKGNTVLPLHPFVAVTLKDNHVSVSSSKQDKNLITGKNLKLYKSIVGTTRANIANTIKGVTQGFDRKLTLVGVGYRAQGKGKVLALSLGYSHPTEYQVPEGITIETPTQTEILVKGNNKELVGLVAAQIRDIRPPEPYKGKGVRYANEQIEIKETKKK